MQNGFRSGIIDRAVANARAIRQAPEAIVLAVIVAGPVQLASQSNQSLTEMCSPRLSLGVTWSKMEKPQLQSLGLSWQPHRTRHTIAINKVVGEIVDEDPDRWSQSSTGREHKMKGNFLRAPTGEYPNQASFADRSHGDFSR